VLLRIYTIALCYYYPITLYHFYLIVSREDRSRPLGSAAPHPVADKLISLFSIIRDCENSAKRYFRFLRRWMDFEGTVIFVSHDRSLLRGLGSRVLELGGERVRTAIPLFILGHTLSTCGSLDMRRRGSIRRLLCNGVSPFCPVVPLHCADLQRR
jgi:hypothetical protein